MEPLCVNQVEKFHVTKSSRIWNLEKFSFNQICRLTVYKKKLFSLNTKREGGRGGGGGVRDVYLKHSLKSSVMRFLLS